MRHTLHNIKTFTILFFLMFLISTSQAQTPELAQTEAIHIKKNKNKNNVALEPIHNIQGSGATSPEIGAKLSIQGIVVGDFQNNDPDVPGQLDPDNGDLNGFYVQQDQSEWDQDESTSEGIFIYEGSGSPNVDVKLGDRVRVSGEVSEYTSGGVQMTQLTRVTEVQVISHGTIPNPVDIHFPLDSINFLERYEGMLIRFPQTLILSDYFNFDRSGEILLTYPLEGLPAERHFTPTAYLFGNTAIDETLREIYLNRITLDDGRPSATGGNTAQNPDPARHPNGKIFNLQNLFRGGDHVTNTVGTIDQSLGKYRIQPIQGADYKAVNPRTPAPDPVGGRLRIISFNVMNYFTDLGTGANFRGANDSTEFKRQKAKIFAAIRAMNPDIAGLLEIENNADTALSNLVDGLNQSLEAGAEPYAYIATGSLGTDLIKPTIIYRPTKVKPIGAFAALTDSAFTTPSGVGHQQNRPSLAQTLEETATGERFTLVVNHLRSKGSGCGEGDDDPRQGNCNGTRTAGAKELLKWIKKDPTHSRDPDFMLIGDFNSFDKEDPIQAILRGADGMLSTQDDFTDLSLAKVGEFAYGYLFDGQVGCLDYALVTQSLFAQVTGAVEWHINADEPDILDYDMTFKKPAQDSLYEPNPYRASDHDPVAVGLNLSHAEINYILSKDPHTCETKDGGIHIVADPANALEYSIDGGKSFQSSPDFKGLASGVYQVVIRNKNNPQIQHRFRGAIILQCVRGR